MHTHSEINLGHAIIRLYNSAHNKLIDVQTKPLSREGNLFVICLYFR